MTGGSAALKDCQEKEGRHEALKVSIMGDSISTFEGCNPPENKVFYQGLTARKNGVFSKELTWWHRVIEGLHAQLCINNAYSGSKVSGKGFPSALSPERIEGLSGRMEPDVILVYMGLNDFGKNVFVGKSRRILWKKNPEHFFDAYCLMLQRMKKRYPKAKVICGTLLKSHVRENPQWRFDGGFPCRYVLEQYNQSIRSACRKNGAICVELDAYAGGEKTYETLDGAHPTGNGHRMMAACWLRALDGINLADGRA